MSPGEKCRRLVESAQQKMREAVTDLEAASHAVRADAVLADGIDPRALAVARTNAETAELWLARAAQ